MTKLFYKDWNPNRSSRELVNDAESIIDEYDEAGYTLTLRQLYYQFVARGIIENTERSYKNLGILITKARMAGLISWESIEDRNREFNNFWYQENEHEVIRKLPLYIRFDKWARQETYIEVWVEKEALGNVISRACDPLLVPYMSCKGYLSASEAWRAGQRYEQKLDEGKNCVLIHLGDHDPSGIDMTRDNKERLDIFSRTLNGVDVKRIALNMNQVEEYNPPPNPTKLTDTRATSYINKYGYTSWELDALEPSYIEDLITNEIHKYIDWKSWEEVGDEEIKVENTLKKLYAKWPTIKEDL